VAIMKKKRGRCWGKKTVRALSLGAWGVNEGVYMEPKR